MLSSQLIEFSQKTSYVQDIFCKHEFGDLGFRAFVSQFV